MGSTLLARTSGFPRPVDARTQILARRRAHRQRLRRQKSLLLMPASRRLRQLMGSEDRRRTLLIVFSACLFGCTAVPVVQYDSMAEAVRITKVYAESRNELHFEF